MAGNKEGGLKAAARIQPTTRTSIAESDVLAGETDTAAVSQLTGSSQAEPEL